MLSLGGQTDSLTQNCSVRDSKTPSFLLRIKGGFCWCSVAPFQAINIPKSLYRMPYSSTNSFMALPKLWHQGACSRNNFCWITRVRVSITSARPWGWYGAAQCCVDSECGEGGFFLQLFQLDKDSPHSKWARRVSDSVLLTVWEIPKLGWPQGCDWFA